MTTEELISKIKAEIERLKGICTAQIKENPGQTFPFVMVMTGYDNILSFLSTLESEKQISQNEDFEKEIADYWTTMGWSKIMTLAKFKVIARYFYGLGLGVNDKTEKPMDLEEELKKEIEKKYDQTKWGYVDGVGSVVMDKGQFIRIARHFAGWGAERQNEQDDRLVDIIYQQGIEKGKDDMKEQMMKEAVEGRVSYFESRDVAVIYYDDPKGNTMCFFAPSSSLESGDKVRIIIVKE